MRDAQIKGKKAIEENNKLLEELKREKNATKEYFKARDGLLKEFGASPEDLNKKHEMPPPPKGLSQKGNDGYHFLIKWFGSLISAVRKKQEQKQTPKEKEASKRKSKIGSRLSKKGLRI